MNGAVIMKGRSMSEIPLLDLKIQYRSMKKDIDEAIAKVVDEQSFILGKEVGMLEREVASYCGTEHGVGVASGTDAIMLALKAVGVGFGDEVITVPFTFIATAGAISSLGAKPVFVDIDKATYTMDVHAIESRITAKTKAIVPVHLYGQCADMDPIMEIANRRKIAVIEDCAQAIGSSYKGRRAGSMGLAGALSFFPSKNLGGFGDGGMVVTNDPAMCRLVKLLHVHGSDVRYVHPMLGYNSRLDNLQAAVLLIKLRHLDTWAKKRQENARHYNEAFSKIPGVVIPFVPETNTHVYHQYVLMVDPSRRDKIVESLVSNGIESRVYYPIPLHLQGCYRDLGYSAGDFPNSERSAAGTFALPVYPELTDLQKDFVIEMVSKICG